MFTVIRTQTCKELFAPEHEYYQWNKDRLQFDTQEEVKEWLHSEYKNCKRVKMYNDDKDGNAEHVGYIYCYNTEKCSYDDCAKNNQDWVQIQEYEPKTVIVK